MRTGYRKFVQAQPHSMLHASPIYNVNLPACKTEADNWLVKELTADEFNDTWRYTGYCQFCLDAEPTYFLVHPRTTYEWSLG